MDYRNLGASGLRVPVLSFGAGTFGGSGPLFGARNEEQLRQNLGAVGWSLSREQIERLDAVSAVTAPYPYSPYRRQEGFARLNPPIV
jgi:aryl-alcohol dehydrogenase-like predicted oxidoreductase